MCTFHAISIVRDFECLEMYLLQMVAANDAPSSLGMSNSSISDAKSTGGSGGGVLASGLSSVVLEGVTIDDTNAKNGGGIYVADSGNVNFMEMQISNSRASGVGTTPRLCFR